MAGRNNRNEDVSDDDIDVDPAENAGCDFDEEGGLRIDDDIYIPPLPKVFNPSDDDKGSRLIIKKIVNNNFKSYAGEVIIGPFHECFSSIVGPNGSGKSNVIDSMLFVFGYRASKIRSKRICELIHQSNEHANVESCTVSVHFQKIIDKDDEYEVIPNSDFTVSKTAFKDNTSFYELNGKKVQFKTIAKIFRDEGVDLDHNRFLILQGEVEQIALMKPTAHNEHDTGLLEFLDDIIGTSRYKVPLEKLTEKIELLTERVTEKLNRLSIVENEREQLKEPMAEAVEYMKTENTITKLQHKLYLCKQHEKSNDLKDCEKFKEELEEDCKKLNEEMENINEEKKLKNTDLKNKSEVWESVQRKSDLMRGKYNKLRNDDEALHAELVETNKRRKANIAALKGEKVKLEQLLKVPEKNSRDIKECEELIKKQSANRDKEEAALKTIMANLREKSEPLLKKRVELETELIIHRDNINEAKAAFNVAESELRIYTLTEKSEKEKLEKYQQILKETSETFNERKMELESLVSKIPATEKSLQKTQEKLDKLRVRDVEISGQLKKVRAQVDEARSAMYAKKSRNRIVDALMREKMDKRIPGILGRLGDLGAIDAKYDVAISTACGPLDNVVVDTMDTAETCVAFLRDNNIGRITFIPLDKVQRFLPQCRQKITTPENVVRLFDKIRVEDERVLPAFYYGLHDTLVANDLDQATRIAYGKTRHRVVTLNGELIETSGTMSGGGRTIIRGRMGQNVVESDTSTGDMAKLEKNVEIITEEWNNLKSQQKLLEQQIETLSSELKQMIDNQSKYKMEMKTLNEQLPVLKSQVKHQEKKAASSVSSPGKVKELTKAVELAKKQLDKVKECSKAAENKVAKINEEINQLSSGEVKEQQNKVANTKQAIDKAKAEICRLNGAIKTAERNSQRTKDKIETLENDVRNCEQRIRDIQEEKRHFESAAKDLIKIIEECAEQLIEKNDVTALVKRELNSLQKREEKLKILKIDLEQKVTDNQKNIVILSQQIKEYVKKMSALRLNEIPGVPVETLSELTDENIATLDSRTLAANIAAAKERLPDKVPNMQIIQEYLQKDELFLRRSGEVEDVTNERNKIRAAYDTAKRRRHEEFFIGFTAITCKLKEMYQMITLGGTAELELVDSLDPYTEGIVFSVRPPKKSWKNISNLSGGEKTLSSLALVFALHHYKPTPLYFMDEIDAALDFKNVSIVGTYIKERTKNAQFIVISLRSEMFELADTLVGIYKTYNTTKSVTLNIREFYKNHEDLAEQEKERRERFALSSKSSSQVIKRKTQTVAQPMSMSLTCPPRIDKSVNDKSQKDQITSHCNISKSPEAKKLRRSSTRRKISSPEVHSVSSSNKSNEAVVNSELPVSKKPRKNI